MSNVNLTLTPCPKCGTSERNAWGVCKECRRVYDRARWAAKHDELNARNRERYATIDEVRERRKASAYAWRRANPDKAREAQDRWFNADPSRREKKHISEKAWRDKNVEHCREKSKRNSLKKAQQYAATRKAYRDANPEKRRAAVSAWSKLNPDRLRIHKQNRRDRESAGNARLSKHLVATLLLLQKGRCACCGKPLGKKYHLDHIVPLAKGGRSVDTNMQLLRGICNQQKGSKHPVDFMQERGFLL